MVYTINGSHIEQRNESSRNITQVEAHADGIQITTDGAHGYAVGDYVVIDGSSNYNGEYIVTSVASTTLVVDTPFVGDIAIDFTLTNPSGMTRFDNKILIIDDVTDAIYDYDYDEIAGRLTNQRRITTPETFTLSGSGAMTRFNSKILIADRDTDTIYDYDYDEVNGILNNQRQITMPEIHSVPHSSGMTRFNNKILIVDLVSDILHDYDYDETAGTLSNERVVTGYNRPNAQAMTRFDSQILIMDGVPDRVYAYTYNESTGALSSARVVLNTSLIGPLGMTRFNNKILIVDNTTDTAHDFDYSVGSRFQNMRLITVPSTIAKGDKDMSGLEDIDGVIVYNDGILAETADHVSRKNYNLGSLALRIYGDQRFHPDTEQITTTAQVSTEGTGHIFIDGELTANGYSYFSHETFLRGDSVGTNHSAAQSILLIKDDTKCTWNGGFTDAPKPVYFEPCAIIRAKAIFMYGNYLITDNRDQSPSLGLQCNDYQIERLLAIGARLDILATAPLATSYIASHESVHVKGAIAPSSNANGNLTYEFTGFDPKGNESDLFLWSGKKLRIINSAVGSDLKIVGNTPADHTRNYGLWEITKKIKFKIIDPAGNPIGGARIYSHDYDNGNRRNYTATDNAGVINNINYTDNKIHNNATAAGTGETDEIEVLTAVVARNTGGAQGTPDEGDNVIDRRGKLDDTTDTFDNYISTYGYLPIVHTEQEKGLGTKLITRPVFVDPFITERDPKTVAAYTGIQIDHTARLITISQDHTLEELYDYVRYDKTLAAHAAEPTPSTYAITANGTTLTTQNYSILISLNSSLSKTDTFDSLILVNGTITIQDGSSSNVAISDSAGVRPIIVSNVPNTAIYCEIDHNDGGTTPSTFQYVITGADGTKVITVPESSTVRITAKAPGYKHLKRTINPAAEKTVKITLTPEPHVDTGFDISRYVENSQGSDGGQIPIANNIFWEYDNATNTGRLVFGEINLQNNPAASGNLFDDRITSKAGLRFLHHYNTDGSQNNILDGNPYEILADRIYINSTVLSFLRIEGMSFGQDSQFGKAVFIQDRQTVYLAAISHGDRVRIDPLSTIFVLNSSQIASAINQATNNDDYIRAISNPIATESLKKLRESGYVDQQVELEFVSSNEPLNTADEANKAAQIGQSANLRHDAPGSVHRYVIYKTKHDITRKMLSRILLDIQGIFAAGTNNILGTPASFDVKVFTDYNIDTIENIGSYILSNPAVIDTDGSAVNDITREPDRITSQMYNRIILAYNSAATNDTFDLRIKNLAIRAIGTRYNADILDTLDTDVEQIHTEITRDQRGTFRDEIKDIENKIDRLNRDPQHDTDNVILADPQNGSWGANISNWEIIPAELRGSSGLTASGAGEPYIKIRAISLESTDNPLYNNRALILNEEFERAPPTNTCVIPFEKVIPTRTVSGRVKVIIRIANRDAGGGAPTTTVQETLLGMRVGLVSTNDTVIYAQRPYTDIFPADSAFEELVFIFPYVHRDQINKIKIDIEVDHTTTISVNNIRIVDQIHREVAAQETVNGIKIKTDQLSFTDGIVDAGVLYDDMVSVIDTTGITASEVENSLGDGTTAVRVSGIQHPVFVLYGVPNTHSADAAKLDLDLSRFSHTAGNTPQFRIVVWALIGMGNAPSGRDYITVNLENAIFAKTIAGNDDLGHISIPIDRAHNRLLIAFDQNDTNPTRIFEVDYEKLRVVINSIRDLEDRI